VIVSSHDCRDDPLTCGLLIFCSPVQSKKVFLYDFRQKDLPVGAVAERPSRGVTPQAARGKATKLPDNGGVLFAAGTSEGLSWPNNSRGLWRNRWWVVIARAEMDGVAEDVPVLTVNGAPSVASRRQSGLPGARARCSPS